jgi:hypothetical protein
MLQCFLILCLTLYIVWGAFGIQRLRRFGIWVFLSSHDWLSLYWRYFDSSLRLMAIVRTKLRNFTWPPQFMFNLTADGHTCHIRTPVIVQYTRWSACNWYGSEWFICVTLSGHRTECTCVPSSVAGFHRIEFLNTILKYDWCNSKYLIKKFIGEPEEK